MKNKTCAAYVCAFLLLVIGFGAFVFYGRQEKTEIPLPAPEPSIEQTVVDVPEEKENGREIAELPRKQSTEPAVSTPPATEKKKEPEKKPKEEPEIETKLYPSIDGIVEEIQTKEKEKAADSDIEIQQKYVEEVYNTAKLEVQNGNIVIAYSQPEIPAQYHLTVKAEVYDKNGKTYCRYVSDAGWLSESSNYDSAAKDVLARMGAGDLSDKMYILVVKVGDGDLLVGATVWQLTHNYDGTEDLVKTYVQ